MVATSLLPRAVRASLTLLALGLVSGTGQAAQDLKVFRGPEDEDGRFSLFVVGALPRQVVELRAFLGHPPADPGLAYRTEGQVLGRVGTDAAGHARLLMDGALWDFGPDLERPFLTVQAFGTSAERQLSWSNVALLETLPTLYLLVESPPGSPVPHRVLCFDPARGQLTEVGRGLARHGVADVRHHANQTFEVGPDQTLYFADPDDPTRLRNLRDSRNPLQDAVLGSHERILDMVATRDDSALVLLTARDLPGQRGQVRLRLLDLATQQPHWITQLPLLRADLPMDAWLVADPLRPQVYVASHSPGRDKIRSVSVGGNLVPGPWLPPSPSPSEDSLVDVKVAGDLLVAVSEASQGATGRVVVMATPSLAPESDRLRSLEVELPGRPRSCVVEADGLQGRVLVLTDDGTVHSLAVDLDRESILPEVLGSVPEAVEMAVSPVHGDVFLLADRPRLGRRGVAVLDAGTGDRLGLAGVRADRSAHHLQVLRHRGDQWLTVVERHEDPTVVETLVVWRLSANGRAVGLPQRFDLEGSVTRLRRR